MSAKCPKCGYQPPRGRPKKLSNLKVRKLRDKGKSLAEIASLLSVTRGAVQASLKRTESCKCRDREGDTASCKLHKFNFYKAYT